MALPTLPTAPSTLRPDTFASEMDAFLSALIPWAAALQAIGSAYGDNLVGTSSTSLTIGTGSKSLTVQTGLSLSPGMPVMLTASSAVANKMLCTVTSYTTGTGALVVNSDSTAGSGTHTSWLVAPAIAAIWSDLSFNNAALGTVASGNLGNCTVDGTNPVGFKNLPQNLQQGTSGTYSFVLSDAGKHIYRTSSSSGSYNIPANSSVQFPLGSTLTVINGGTGSATIACADSLRLVGTWALGTRTLAGYGSATAVKVADTEWAISGVGLT